MRIRMLVDMPAGASRNGEPWPAKGEVTEDIPTADAAHLVASGVAEVAEDPAPRRSKPAGRSAQASDEQKAED